jgi:hypothetical protein
MGDMRLDHGLLRLSLGKNAPPPMASAVGHHLTAAHDPADGTDSSVNASSRGERYNPSSMGRRIAPLHARLIGHHSDNWLRDGLKHVPLTP